MSLLFIYVNSLLIATVNKLKTQNIDSPVKQNIIGLAFGTLSVFSETYCFKLSFQAAPTFK